MEIASTLRQQYPNAEQLALAAEIQYCYENELCTTELDFVIRRSGMLYFDKVRLDKHIDFIHTYFSNLLRRTETQRTVSYTNFTSALHEVTEFSN